MPVNCCVSRRQCYDIGVKRYTLDKYKSNLTPNFGGSEAPFHRNHRYVVKDVSLKNVTLNATAVYIVQNIPSLNLIISIIAGLLAG